MTTAAAPYVAIVTGSRQASVELRALVHRDLDTLFLRLRATGRRLVVRHGACPTGADHYASEWVRLHQDHGVTEDPHPADWTGPCHRECGRRHRRQSSSGRSRCPAAGPRRNRGMVALGADVVLAFPVGASRGTRGCMRLAEESGLTVEVPAELRSIRGVA